MAASIEVTDEPTGVRVLTVSNPDRRNALDTALLEQLRAALVTPPSIRALLVRGAGDGVFCAGYDLNELAAYQPGQVPPDDHIAQVLDGLSNHELPTVALITGPAFGAGCELAMACDVRVGDERARFCMPPVKLGLVYSLKGFNRIAHRVGVSATRFLFLTSRQVEAQRALQLGMLDLLEPVAEAASVAMTLATEMAAAPRIAIEGTKKGLSISNAEQRAQYEALRQASYASAETRARVMQALNRTK